MRKLIDKANKLLSLIDRIPLWWVGIALTIIVSLPVILLGEGSYFDSHDQLDEGMLSYILPARHFGEFLDEYPEMMGGISTFSLLPPAYIFVPIFRLMSTFHAFEIQWISCTFIAFLGMYALIKKTTNKSILAVVIAGCFAVLPFFPGMVLTVTGVPLIIWSILSLKDRERLILCYILVALFACTSGLEFTGIFICVFWFVANLIWYFKGQRNIHLWIGLFELGIFYLINRYQAIWGTFFPKKGYVSHRTEFVFTSSEFWTTVKETFWHTGQHVYSYHERLVAPIVLFIIIALVIGIIKKRINKYLWWSIALFLLNIIIAILVGFYNSAIGVEWRNNQNGFFAIFNLARIYWFYPLTWYTCFAFSFMALFDDEKTDKFILLKYIVLFIVVLPTVLLIKDKSIFFANLSQYNNGSEVTGFVTWENYYAEDLMKEIDSVIGRDKGTYRIANLGISPCPALAYGFYTIDGYCTNYDLEYKHKFREIIKDEIEQTVDTKAYFDDWGSRCYLFNSQTGTYYSLPAGNDIKYSGLKFNIEAMKKLGCEYIFSGAEIEDYQRMELDFLGYYSDDVSYWGIYLYKLK